MNALSLLRVFVFNFSVGIFEECSRLGEKATLITIILAGYPITVKKGRANYSTNTMDSQPGERDGFFFSFAFIPVILYLILRLKLASQ